MIKLSIEEAERRGFVNENGRFVLRESNPKTEGSYAVFLSHLRPQLDINEPSTELFVSGALDSRGRRYDSTEITGDAFDDLPTIEALVGYLQSPDEEHQKALRATRNRIHSPRRTLRQIYHEIGMSLENLSRRLAY